MIRKWILVAILLVGVGVVVGKSGWKGGVDFRLGVMGDWGLELVTISPSRGMINVLGVPAEKKVWIPGGLGWYSAGKLKKVLDQEKKWSIVGEIFSWNYGFLPMKVVSLKSEDDWSSFSNLGKVLGGWGWLRYLKLEREALVKEEMMGNDLTEIMPREMADSRLGEGEIWVRVMNTSESVGLANFVAERLSWAGLGVLSAENAPVTDSGQRCLIKYRDKILEKSLEMETISTMLGGCDKVIEPGTADGELIVLIGQKLSTMIKYPSYVGTF